MDKKGLMFRNLVAGIIVLVIAGILLLVITNVLKGAGETADREACRTSVLLTEKSKIAGYPVYNDLNCKTEVYDVKMTNEEEIYKFITYRMYDCWYQFGEGEVDFVSNIDPGRSDEWCWICSRIDFDENIQEKYSEISMEDFHNYLRTENIPLNEEQTFYEYFYDETPGQIEGNIDDPAFNWKTDEPLYISFLADHNRKYDAAFWVELATGTGMLALCGGAVFLAATTSGVSTPLAVGVCTRAGIVAATSFTLMTSVKGEYLMGLNVASGEETVQWCNENR